MTKNLIVMLVIANSIMLQSCGTEPTKKGNLQKAVEDYVQLGLGYMAEGKRDQARFNFLRAIKIDATSPVANNGIALLYQTEEEFDLAEKHFKAALKTDDKFTQARNNYARFLFFQQRYNEAQKQYQLVSADVNYRLRPQSFIGLALSEKSLGNFSAAERALRRALTLNPRFGAAALELVDLKYEQREFSAAKELLKQYESMTQANPRSLKLGAQISNALGDIKSRAGYTMALANMYPSSPEAKSLLNDSGEYRW